MHSLLDKPPLMGWLQSSRRGWFPLVLLLVWLVGRAGGHGWWEGVTGVARQCWLMLSACLALLAWWQVGFGETLASDTGPHPLRSFGSGVWAAMAWGCVWLALPAWGLLKFASLLAFAPVLAWQRHTAGRHAEAAGLWVGYVLCGLLAAFLLVVRPWRASRLLQAVWPNLPDVQGPHYEVSQLMNTLAALNAWGPAAAQVPSVLANGDSGAWWLHAGVAWGWVPMGLCAVATVLVWVSTAMWLQRTPIGNELPLPLRRLGVALAWFHALATGLYGAWSLGWLYRPMGALPPLTHAGWSVLTLALAWCVRCAWLQRQQRTPALATETGPTRAWWGILAAVSCVGAMGVVGMPERVQNWTELRYAPHVEGRYTPIPRPRLLDRTGQHVLAKQEVAHDLWVRPSEFWGASLQNPKATMDVDGRLNNAQRRAVLLAALAPWSQAARQAGARLDAWPQNDGLPKLLLWAQPPEVVEAVRNAVAQQGLTGLEFTARPLRVYPQGPLTAHAVGFASLATPLWGQAGLEQALDYVDGLWQNVATRDPKPKVLHTSLDLGIQRMAHIALRETMSTHDSPRGAVVVADAHTGEVLGMVSAPSYDPNEGLTFRNPHRPDRIRNLATDVPLTAGTSLLAPLLLAEALQQGALPMTALKPAQPNAEAPHIRTLLGRSKTKLEDTSVLKNSGLTRLAAMVGIQNTGLIDSGWFTWVDDPDESLYQGGNTTLTGVVQGYLPIANGGVDLTLTLLSTQHSWPKGLKRDAPQQVLTSQTACAVRNWMMAQRKERLQPSGPATSTWRTSGALGLKTLQEPLVKHTRSPRMHKANAIYVGMLPVAQPRYVVGVLLGFDQAAAPKHGRAVEALFDKVAQGLVASSANPSASESACSLDPPPAAQATTQTAGQ